MRDFKSMKRQRGRNRKPGGGGHGNNPNRAFDSNGPEGIKVRGNAQHVYERYQQLARDAASAGDRVLAENFLQHAEHYFRLIRAMQPNRPVAEIAARDASAAGFDIDFEDESGVPQVDPGYEESQQNQGGDNDRSDNRDNREARDDRDFRRDRDRGDRDRDRNRDDRDRDRSRDDRPSGDNGEGGGRRESRRERFERQRAERRARYGDDERGGEDRGGDDRNGDDRGGDAMAVVEPKAAPLVDRDEDAQPVLRAKDGGESHMPAFLGRAASAPAEDEAPAKPKRAPRKRKTAEETAGEEA